MDQIALEDQILLGNNPNAVNPGLLSNSCMVTLVRSGLKVDHSTNELKVDEVKYSKF